MRSTGRTSGLGLGVLAIVWFGSHARADVRPPVKVTVPPERLRPATSGQPYEGALEVSVGASGVLDDFQLSGEGWQVTLLNSGKPVEVNAGDSYLVEFRGTPVDSSAPLNFTVMFGDNRIEKQIDLSPRLFAEAGKSDQIANVDALGRARNFSPTLKYESANTAGGQILRLHGTIAYMSPSTLGGPQDTIVGADNVYYEVVDEDDISDEVIYAGLTDMNGNFDVVVNWDDCDISGCDDPDIYLRWELDNGILAVQRSDILEEDYSWSTEDNVIDDFTGSDVDFGVVMPADTGQHPAIHIHNNITRAHRYLQTVTGIALERVEVQWPESGTGAFYSDFWEEIHISPNEQWVEGTIIHEYGHHLLENYSENVSPDYCNDFCDGEVSCTAGDDCDKKGHCLWCPETDHDAWNEGFPNWFGSVVTRTYPSTYGRAALSANDSRYTLETPGTCCQDGMTYSALITEGYIAALLRDMDDGADDDHSGGSYVCTAPVGSLDCVRDSLSVPPNKIFDVALNDDPITPLEFIQDFRAKFPEYDQDLWSTVNNVAPAYSFPVPAPEVKTQTMECKINMAGDPLTIEAFGNGSVLRYQWQKFNVDLNDIGNVSGAHCPQLTLNPLSPADAGIYRATISTCDQSQSVQSLPVRVSVLPARGAGTKSGSWGLNNFGQLGRGVFDVTGEYRSGVPAPMIVLSDAISISSGGNGWHKLALKSNGDVWGWGANSEGQLGKDPLTLYSSNTPILIEGVSNIIQVANGVLCSMALRADGKVITWGDNDYGQRGDGNFYGYYHVPYQIPELDCIVSISSGDYHAAAVKSDGTVWTWGYGYYQQLGWDSTGLPFHSSPKPHQVPGISDAVAVAAGGYHTLVLRGNGTVLAFGRNDEGQLGDGTTTTRFTPMTVPGLTNVAAVRAGTWHSLAILQDGTVRGWGDNGGKLGNGSMDRAFAPVQPLDIGPVLDVQGGYYHTMYLRADKTVWVSGWNVYGELGPRPYPEPLRPLPVTGIFNALAVGAGWGTSFALSSGVGPYIWQQPENKTVLVGQPATFSIQNFGTPTFTYQWSRNGNDLLNGSGFSGVNTPTLNLSPVTAAMAGTYRVRVENAFGFTLSVMASLTVTCPNGDGNCDGRIDQVDLDGLADCLNGPFGLRPEGCGQVAFGNFDVNNDNDVDLRDAAVVQNCFNGDDVIDPACGQ